MSSDDDGNLRLHDPVYVTSSDGDDLEGIVAHLGPVQFAPGSDWIGVRLHGADSVGRGKNDGSVKGVSYFDAGGESNGMFVRRGNVRRRKLTKLEGIRLRRELSSLGVVGAGGGGAASSSVGDGRRTSSSSGGRRASSAMSPAATTVGRGGASRTSVTPKKPGERATTSSASSGGGGGGSSKLEELRARREKLARERAQGVSRGVAGGSITPKAGSTSGGGASRRSGGDVTTSIVEENIAKNLVREAIVRGESEEDDAGGHRGGDLVGSEVTVVAAAASEDAGGDEAASTEQEGDDGDGNDGVAPTATTTTVDTVDTPHKPTQNIDLTRATPGYRAELSRLQSRIASLEANLKRKEAECTSLQSSLDFMSRGAEQSTHDAVRMYAMGALALTEAKSPKGARGGGAATPSGKGGAGEGDGSESDGGEGGSDDDGDEEEDEGDEEGNEAVVNQAAAAVSQALVERNDKLTAELAALAAEKSDLEHDLSEAMERCSNLASRYEASNSNYESERDAREAERRAHAADEAVSNSRISSLERELKVLHERVSAKSDGAEQSHVASAKLRAEVTSLRRRAEEAESEKLDAETTLEELVLDKEQLREEKELLEDQLEECKIDLESAQLELDEARARLEEGRDAAAVEADLSMDRSAAGADASFSSNAGADADDVTRSLTLQNARLRTALLRLREQSENERGELQRQVKALRSDAAGREEVEAELASLRSAHADALAEARELKDVIDQTSALEETIETLSDKAWNLEETNAELERTIRELEEAAEIAAEMEEVQADELRMVMRDLEGRDALVGNLEEAIRMQRRREEDFQRYVSEFRSSISTLKSEKEALLALTSDSQGEKSHLMATSQKALAQAAQMAADAAEARKLSSEAAFQRIAARSSEYLCRRLESLLPSGVVSAELAAVKGEMSLAKISDKAAESLVSVEEVFNRAIDKGAEGLSEFDIVEGGESMILSDAAKQQIAVMTHQAEFSRIAIEGSTDALRLMAAGQWPELLSQEMSTDLGSAVLTSVADLDLALSDQLRLLKSEGVLSPLRSSLADLEKSVNNTRLALFSATDESGNSVIPDGWKPPGWEALRFLSLGRFACLGATSVLSSAVSPIDDDEPPPATPPNFAQVLGNAKQNCASILGVSKKLAGLSLDDTEILSSLDDLANQYHSSSMAFYQCVKTTFATQSVTAEDVAKFAKHLEEVHNPVRLLDALLRKADLGDHETGHYHQLSAEYGDSWGGVTDIIAQVRGVDGDSEDVNYLMRSRAIENQLTEAVNNEPKLVIADAKIASLEKSLSSRSKEIQMQNTRIAELETLISKSSLTPMSPLKGSTSGSAADNSADTQKLKEEVRVLQEALDVMQKQAEEYEKEIRSLKDKSRPSRGVRTAGGRVTPKKSSDLESTLNQLGQGSASKSGMSSRDILLESISLETALYRPALSSAAQSASYWKAKAMGTALAKLPPLNLPKMAQTAPASIGDESKCVLEARGAVRSHRCMEELALAKKEARLVKAALKIVDLSNSDISARAQLEEGKQREQEAEMRLQKAASSLLSLAGAECLASFPPPVESSNVNPLGRITLPCRDGTGFVSQLPVTTNDLRNLTSFLVQ